jgi:hypothetical protein
MCSPSHGARADTNRILGMDFGGISYWSSRQVGRRVEIYRSGMDYSIMLHCDEYFIRLITDREMSEMGDSSEALKVIELRTLQWVNLIEEVLQLEGDRANV